MPFPHHKVLHISCYNNALVMEILPETAVSQGRLKKDIPEVFLLIFVCGLDAFATRFELASLGFSELLVVGFKV